VTAELHSGMYINCVYCGHRYGPKEDTPVSMADVLKAHIKVCQKHPLAAALARAESAERECGEARRLLAEYEPTMWRHVP
jgi:DNA-directed RNA polymerase subunit RPC12/RpoP